MTTHYLVLAAHSWGKGPTLKSAYDAIPHSRPRLKRDGCIVYEFDSGKVKPESLYVDDMGGLRWEWTDAAVAATTQEERMTTDYGYTKTKTDGRALLARIKAGASA